MEQSINRRLRFLCGNVTVLELNVILPGELSDVVRAFYEDIVADFEKAVGERLSERAAAAYRTCTDRRKRWRYEPWIAKFSLERCGDCIYELTVSINGTPSIHERHIWRGDVIVRRTKI